MSIRLSLLFIFTIICTQRLFADTLSISSNPATLTINSAVAGQQPSSVTNASTYYNTTTTNQFRDILGRINGNMPTGLTLTVELAAPNNAMSNGPIAMTTVNQNLVTSLKKRSTETGLTITFRLSATAQAAPVTNGSRILTLTLQ